MFVVVVKISVRMRFVKCTPSTEAQQLHQKIEEFKNRTHPRSTLTDIIISQLMSKGIQIIRSQLDGYTLVVSFWCRSKEALKHIQKFYKSKQLTNVLFCFGNIRPSAETIQSTVINIDSGQFRKTVGKFLWNIRN